MSSQDSQPFNWHYTQVNDNDFQIRGHTLFFIIVLFSVVFLITLLFLYARWVCRNHPQHFPTNPISHVPIAPPSQPQGLDPSIIKALPIVLHQSSLGTCSNNNGNVPDPECCICLSVFEDGDKVKVLPKCHHCFHSDCVDRWLTAQSSCPLCRASLQVTGDSVLLSIVTD